MILFIIICLIICWYIYQYFYYKSEKFIEIKESITEHTKNCNDLNEHIEELKNAYVEIKNTDYGQADYTDKSRYNYRRPELKKSRDTKNAYNCSLTVCNGAKQQPFKYVCKYFNIKTDEDTLSNFENVLNDFSAAEQGKLLLKKERDNIIESISNKIPFLIKTIGKRKLIKKLGFDNIDFSQLYFPKYSFRYISGGGNSSMSCDVVFNVENLDKFINYLSGLVKFRKSIVGQRALMTSALREKIKNRDKYSCKSCGLSIEQEPNLLL